MPSTHGAHGQGSRVALHRTHAATADAGTQAQQRRENESKETKKKSLQPPHLLRRCDLACLSQLRGAVLQQLAVAVGVHALRHARQLVPLAQPAVDGHNLEDTKRWIEASLGQRCVCVVDVAYTAGQSRSSFPLA